MQVSIGFVRLFFTALSILLMTTLMVATQSGFVWLNALIGVVLGVCVSAALIGMEKLVAKFQLRSLLLTMIGLFFGYILAQGLLMVFHTFLDLSSVPLHFSSRTIEIMKTVLLLVGLYLGAMMTIKAADTFSINLPFLTLSKQSKRPKNLLLDATAIADHRTIDLCSTGIFDHQLIIPKFLTKELHSQLESTDELLKSKAKKSLDILKKLERMADVELEYTDTDFPEMKDPTIKYIRIAKMLECNILSSDTTRIQLPTTEGVRIINLNNLSSSLKPIMQAGEIIKIKIQRIGKEPNQGVGYLEDGTMVVVNGGGESIGEVIETQVLSVKHTHSGRMIFCNACDEGAFSEYASDIIEE